MLRLLRSAWSAPESGAPSGHTLTAAQFCALLDDSSSLYLRLWLPFYRRCVKGRLQTSEFLMNGNRRDQIEERKDRYRLMLRLQRPACRWAIWRANKVFPGNSFCSPASNSIARGLFFSRVYAIASRI